MIGYPPRESLVLLPVRDGAPTGALRFSLPSRDPEPSARAFVGALGRFGRAESAIAALYTDEPRRPTTVTLIDALRATGRRIGMGDIRILHAQAGDLSITGEPTMLGRESARNLLPFVDRALVGAVADEVDALLDRHPSARLPQHLCVGVDSLLRRAMAGGAEPPRAVSAAALIVCAQRAEWIEHVIALVSPGLLGGVAPEVMTLIGVAAASAPETERAPLLVLLAMLHDASGRREQALVLARWAARIDPHDLLARRLLAILMIDDRRPVRLLAA